MRQGALASGDCAHKIHVWSGAPGGTWAVDGEAYVGHTASVEDLAWSPAEAGVFMSCGCDSTLRVWDVRKKAGSALHVDEGERRAIRRNSAGSAQPAAYSARPAADPPPTSRAQGTGRTSTCSRGTAR